MAEKKLSEELRFCIEQDGCSKCSCFETKSKLTCPGLLQKAYETVKRYEEMFTCNIGDTVYEICEGFIEPCTVEKISIADYMDGYGNSSYMAEIHYDREDCPWVATEIFFTDIGKTVFLEKEAAENALKEMEDRKNENARTF